MKIFRMLLTAFLGSVIVVATCGVITFVMYLAFLRFQSDYQMWLITSVIVDICAIALLTVTLHRFGAAALSVATGAFFHWVIYALRWHNNMFATTSAADALIVIIMLTAGYLSGRRSEWRSPSGIESNRAVTRQEGFWASLDQASKVAIITSLITALAGIVTTLLARK